jgi:putative transposase
MRVQLVSVGSSRGESNFHLIFTPKYRRDVFVDEEVKRMCVESFAETCSKLSIGMEACEFGSDHAHVFISRCKNFSVPYMVQRLKGASSHMIRHRLWSRVKGKLWGDSFWSDGYFYRSVGSTTSEAVRYYVENSQRKHLNTPDYEETKIKQKPRQAKLTDFT